MPHREREGETIVTKGNHCGGTLISPQHHCAFQKQIAGIVGLVFIVFLVKLRDKSSVVDYWIRIKNVRSHCRNFSCKLSSEQSFPVGNQMVKFNDLSNETIVPSFTSVTTAIAATPYLGPACNHFLDPSSDCCFGMFLQNTCPSFWWLTLLRKTVHGAKSGMDKLSVRQGLEQHRRRKTDKSKLQNVNINQADVCEVGCMRMRTKGWFRACETNWVDIISDEFNSHYSHSHSH